MAISLKILKSQTTQLPSKQPIQVLNNKQQNTSIYRDIKMDVQTGRSNGQQLFKADEVEDIAPIYDIAAVQNAVKNVFTTSPGEKLLNPTFGIDLRSYLFEPITQAIAYIIGEQILYGLPAFEPRVVVDNVSIKMEPEKDQYQITLRLSVPSLNVTGLSLASVLNRNGYIFI